LYDFHSKLGAKLVPFAGYEMPVQYPEGVLREHLHCRNGSSLFDVSHMGQLKIHGKDRVAFIESLVVGDIQTLPVGHARLSVFTTEKGGIIDDTVITNAGDHLYVVINAGCADKDIAHLEAHLQTFHAKGGDVSMEIFSEKNSLIAVQGPHTERHLSKLAKGNIADMLFMTQKVVNIGGIECLVTRCGYTGEDGYEISVPTKHVDSLALSLLETTKTDETPIKPAGLGARDSLRLEAGLCLYGHDLNEDITPIEGSLAWLISKRRRDAGGFPGAEVILSQLKNGVSKKRVGFVVKGSPAREEATIHDPATKEEIGKVTSGTFSPSLKYPVGMGYVKDSFSKADTPVLVRVRGRDQEGTIAKMPFVPHHYKKAVK